MLFMKDFCELKVWQKTHALTLAVYRITARFPREELYGRRAKYGARVRPFPPT
jgi:hypothetical protein